MRRIAPLLPMAVLAAILVAVFNPSIVTLVEREPIALITPLIFLLLLGVAVGAYGVSRTGQAGGSHRRSKIVLMGGSARMPFFAQVTVPEPRVKRPTGVRARRKRLPTKAPKRR